jgi:hypothetical protein
MKKLAVNVFCLVGPLFVFCQVQRLALLPSTMKFAEDVVPSLCIDFFNEAPGVAGTTSYSKFKDFKGNDIPLGTISVDSYHGVKLPGEGQNQPIFMSATNNLGDISTNYKTFIERKINQAKNAGNFDREKLDDLQSEIWSYDVLNHIGYINPQEEAMAGYTNARNKLSRELYGDESATTEDILEFANKLEVFKEPPGHRIAKIRIIRNEANNSYLAFNKIGAPLYKGSDMTALAAQLGPRVNNADVILIDEFENELQELAFMKNLQRKLGISYSKEVTVCTGGESYLFEARNHSIEQSFRADKIVETQRNDEPVFTGKMKTKTEDEIYGYDITTIEGTSNNRSLLTNFFTAFSTKIRNLSDRISLTRLNKQIKTQVMSSMNLNNTDYLDLILISEAEYKVLVRIRKGTITIIDGYAAR